MAICYLEVDDEITSAIGRLRAVKDGEVVIVVPPGSRIATSRINFKLLAREATERRLNAVAVSDEPPVRALAISAGLPAYDSVAAAEAALASFREQDRRLAERLGSVPPRAVAEPATPVGEQTRVLRTPGGTSARADGPSPADTAVLPVDASVAGGGAFATDGPRAASRRRTGRRRVPIAPLLVVVLLGLLVVGVGYGAYVFLPTATITIKPVATELRPPAFTVTADPNVAVVDPEAAVIPAQQISLPVHAAAEFNATGIQARDTRATGSVRFRSENTVDAVPVPQGSVGATTDGVEFETVQGVTIPRADFATSTPGTADVEVRALRPGTRGNVGAGTITALPAALSAQLVTVRNPDPTSGGRHVEETVISQEDYDSAVAALTGQLPSALAATLADPAGVPRGLAVFPATAQIGDPQADQPPAALVGTVAATFALALDAEAQVIAVNESLIDEVSSARLAGELVPGQKLVGDEVESHNTGSVVGSTIVYQVTSSGLAYTEPDPPSLIAQVRGKSVADARQALAQYGTVEITVWPDFVDRLPDQASRISVTVMSPAGS